MIRFLFFFALSSAVAGVVAQTYPTKPIRFIVPQATGGASDVLARIVAMKLAEVWGQQVIVDNRVGAGGNIGTELVARAPRDVPPRLRRRTLSSPRRARVGLAPAKTLRRADSVDTRSASRVAGMPSDL